ncbi:MAG: hypothetical protein ACLQIB_41980 [Isosphaeraceae bacterium]
MKYFGFSIASLMVVVGFVAVIVAAFRESSALWASITFSLTLVCLSAASVLAICGRARPAWAGMAVFGFVYIHFAFGQIEYPPLLTSNLLDATAEKVLDGKKGEVAYYSRQGQFETRDDLKEAIKYTTKSVPVTCVDLLAYRQIGHSAIGLLVGVAGAMFGLIVAPGAGGRRQHEAGA